MKQLGLLAVLFVVLLAAVIVKESSRPDAGSLRDQVSLTRLGPAALTADDVDAIEIAGLGGADAFKIVRNGDVWVVEGAFRAPASAGAVERLLVAVVEARAEPRLDDDAALAQFDLSPERAAGVVLRNAAGSIVADFALGRSSGPQGAFVRLRFEDAADGAFSVSQDIRGALGLPRTETGATTPATPVATHFHDVNLPNLALDATRRVELMSPGWTLAYEKAGAEWAPVEGAPDLPSRSSGVRQLISTLGGALTATKLVDPAQRAELGLDEPTHRVTAVLEDGSRRSAVGAADHAKQRFFVRLDVEQDPDVVYECTKGAWERLFPPGSQLFEFASLGVENRGLGQVRIEGVPEPFVMTRTDNDMQESWSVREPAWPLPPVDTALRNYVTLLNGARPVDWYAGAEPFREEAVIRYGAEADAPEALTSLRIGQPSPSGTGRLAIFPTDPDSVIVLASSTAERLLPDVVTLFEKRPLSGVIPADITGVTCRSLWGDSADPVLFELTRGEDGKWTVTHAETEEQGDSNTIASWLDDVIRIEVVERMDAEKALYESAMYEIEVRRGDQVTTLGVGPALGGKRRLTVDGAAFVTDSDVEIPAATSLVAADAPGDNPGDGTPDEEPVKDEQE